MRTGRSKAPIIYNEKSNFEIGKGIKLREGKDVCLVGIGMMTFEALEAADILKQKGIDASVIDMHTIKPLDEKLLIEEARKTKAFVVAEEHSIWGGLGSAVSQALSKNYPVPMEFVAVNDTYAESGTPEELFEKYGLTSKKIAEAAERVIKKRN